ncbi:MAG: hypothetical protein HY696_12100 [Deltaproteobacteria bacterium]|nr:hypothetical protein [Deltaproteobacteria bacterium]
MQAIFAPLHEEIKHLHPLLEIDTTVYLGASRLWHGKIGSHELCLIRAGLGEPALAAIATYCFRVFRPTAALLLGFGGGTLPNIHVGDLILGKELITADGQHRWTTSEAALRHGNAAATAAELPLREGIVAIHEQPVSSPHEKAFAGTQYGAAAASTEGRGFIEAAEYAHVPWLVARAIVDPVEVPLPEGFAPLDESGCIAIGALLRAIARQPSLIGALSSLHMAANRARDTLTTFAKSWLATT